MGRILPPSAAIGLHYGIDWTKLFTKREIDEFISLYETPNTSEPIIHDFLKRQPKFLYALGAYQAALSEIPFQSTIRDSSGELLKLRPDFFLQEASGIWDVVELKKADCGDLSLIVGQIQRRRFGAVVDAAIAQVKTYLRELDKPEVQRSLVKSRILVDQPQAWLIIGRDKDLPPREMRLLEKELPHGIRIVTYDSLCNLAKQRAVIMTKSMLLPCIEPLIVPAEPKTVQAQPDPEVVEQFVREKRLRLVVKSLETQLPHSVRELAEQVHLSPGHLQRLFKQETGVHLSDLLFARRLDMAAELLTSTDMAILEIAGLVGYGHYSSFVRAFQGQFGQSPTKYRLKQA